MTFISIPSPSYVLVIQPASFFVVKVLLNN